MHYDSEGDAIGLAKPVTGTDLAPDTTLQDFLYIFQSAERPVRIPVTVTFPLTGVSPACIYKRMASRPGFLLESMDGIPRRATRSLIGTGPLELLSSPPVSSGNSQDGGPLGFLRTSAGPPLSIPGAPAGFCGGLVGYCSYDLVSGFYPGMLDAGTESGRPPGRFMLASAGLVIDHRAGTCTAFDTPVTGAGDDAVGIYERAAGNARRLADLAVGTPPGESVQVQGEGPEPAITTTVGKKEFMEQVVRVLAHIRAGDIFQTVISRRFETPYAGDPFRLYEAVRAINPSPYLYYLDFGDEVIIGSSPEMLVKVEEKTVSTVPIAGTRPRGSSPEEDDRLARDLLSDEKERAEHLMLVDLARNDIGRVAAYGSVQVTSFMEVERFSHVQHLTSRVSGELSRGHDSIDALAACFPAGTVSGAPKLRAMQIIRDIEPHPRGLYAGAVGYIGFDRNLEFAIAIRTMMVRDGKAMFQTGAGIVADSDPEREFEETEKKAGALFAALKMAGGPL